MKMKRHKQRARRRRRKNAITGHEFRQRRLALGYTTRTTLAPAIGVSESQIQRFENNLAPIPLTVELALSAVKPYEKGNDHENASVR